MIVFSATHNPTGRAFVGSCRLDLAFHWTMLVAQADAGVQGALFESIRTDGSDAFSIALYGEANSTREVAELCREAAQSLDAELIKAQARQARQTFKDIKTPVKTIGEPTAVADAANPVTDTPEPTAIKAVTAAEKVLRESKSTEAAADMKLLMAGIEARRLSQRKNPPKKPARRGPSASAAKEANANAKAAKAAKALPKKKAAASARAAAKQAR